MAQQRSRARKWQSTSSAHDTGLASLVWCAGKTDESLELPDVRLQVQLIPSGVVPHLSRQVHISTILFRVPPCLTSLGSISAQNPVKSTFEKPVMQWPECSMSRYITGSKSPCTILSQKLVSQPCVLFNPDYVTVSRLLQRLHQNQLPCCFWFPTKTKILGKLMHHPYQDHPPHL